MKKSLEYFQQAIEKDPGYALAYAGLADSYGNLAGWQVMAPGEAFTRMRAAAVKALEIDESLAEAHAALGSVMWWFEWNRIDAEMEFKRAIELNPGYAYTHGWYGHYLSALGRHDEAIAEVKRARDLDPLSLMINAGVADALFNARRYDEAVAQCRRTLELNQAFYPAHVYLGCPYEKEKLYGMAISECQKAIALQEGNPGLAADLARGYAAAGMRTDALKIISKLRIHSNKRYVQPYRIALIYAALGDFDQAFMWLEKAYDKHSPEVLWAKVDPRIDPLRSDPRFRDLLRRMNF